MSRNFLFILLSLAVAGLLWGAQGDTADGATVDKNAGSSSSVVIEEDGWRTPGVIRVPYLVLRSASRAPKVLVRALTWLPRHVAANVAQSLTRLMAAFKEYATDILGYLASSERTELVRVRRGVPVKAGASRPKRRSKSVDLVFLMFRLLGYPLKMAYKIAYNAVRFSALAGTANLLSSLLASNGMLLGNPLVRKVNNATREVADYAIAGAWNFTKRNVLPRLDGFVTDLKDSGSVPQSLMSVLLELQTLYHIFKFLGMA